MDNTDYHILNELQKDGRLSNVELAEKVNLSPSPCLRRVRLLEESGVIQSYTTLVDHEKYGLPVTVFVSVRLERQNQESIQRFEQGINALEEVMECYLMAGKYDYLLLVVSHSIKNYEYFVRDQLTRIPGIAELESSFAFGRVKYNTQLPKV